MRLFKKRKKETEICVACGTELEYDGWNFPFVFDVCRRCTAEGIRWAAAQQLKEEHAKKTAKEAQNDKD